MKIYDGLQMFQAGIVRGVRTVAEGDFGRAGTWVDVDCAGSRLAVDFKLNPEVKEGDLVRIVSQCRDRAGELFASPIALEVVQNPDADFETLLLSPYVCGLVACDLESYNVAPVGTRKSVTRWRVSVFFFGGHTYINVGESEDVRQYAPLNGIQYKPVRFAVEAQTRRRKTADEVRSYDVLVLSKPLLLREKKTPPTAPAK